MGLEKEELETSGSKLFGTWIISPSTPKLVMYTQDFYTIIRIKRKYGKNLIKIIS
jgi:RNase P/RNase MRP subunit POP5